MTTILNKKTFDQSLAELSKEIRQLIPDKNLEYYKKTNEMHCDIDKPGGSKFTGVDNILEVLKKDENRIIAGIKNQTDDRDQFLNIGVSKEVFLPNALYFKVDNIKGKLGIIQIKNLTPNTKVIIRREKSLIDELTGKEKIPCSLSVVSKSLNMPEVDFATVIISHNNNGHVLQTIHPGSPIKPTKEDFIIGSEKLTTTSNNKKQRIIIITVKDLLDTKKITEDDYVKIINDNEDEFINQFEIVDGK